MPVEDNKQAVRRFYDDVVNGRSLDAVDELLTPDGVDDTFGSQSDVAVPARAEDADGQGFRRLVHLHKEGPCQSRTTSRQRDGSTRRSSTPGTWTPSMSC